MTERDLDDFLILRLLDEPVSRAEFERACERSAAALETVRDDDIDIDWVESEVMANEDAEIVGTLCHYKSESEDAIHQHADCAGAPVTRIERRNQPVEGSTYEAR